MAHYDFRADLLRSLDIFERNRALLAKQSGMVDLEAEFSRATGLSPRHFIELCLVVGTPYRMMNAGSLINNDPNFFIDKNRFGNMKLGDAELTSFFSTVARTAQQLADYLPVQGERPLADTTVFQSWPVIRTADGERYYCCDVASLMDKTGRGLYWTLFGAADKPTRGKLGGTYGRAFEAYLHNRVRRAGFALDAYLESPLFADGAEVCDGLFVEGIEPDPVRVQEQRAASRRKAEWAAGLARTGHLQEVRDGRRRRPQGDRSAQSQHRATAEGRHGHRAAVTELEHRSARDGLPGACHALSRHVRVSE